MADDAGIRELDVSRVESAAGARACRDTVVIEAPLEFRVDGQPGAVTMRTPGHDEDLLRGFLFAEGMIADASELRGVERLREHVVDVTLAHPLVRKRLPERSMFASSSCGVCGKVSIESLRVHAPRVNAALRVRAAVISALPDRLREAQQLFDATGGLHAAGAFSPDGALEAVREDVGRHNAVDKLVGWALSAGRMPLSNTLLCVSGRLSFEIVQKAVVAGFPVIAAVSAPSSLAVELADEYGVTLCGFVRDGRFNVYTHEHRVDLR